MECNLHKYRVDPREIHFIRFIMEACDHVAVVSTLDVKSGLISLSVPPDREEEAEEIMNSLGRSIFLDKLEDREQAP
ncbi:protein of unknown function [Desulfatibacillum alkenivorans DSM 16219]|jgi:hypothetical protein|uniref:DUF4911 domain-containing protein n=1 Tax=Desulfatibacillum alkenivorans DSM 16219 TaxID=1121393 RepID=A0A1M6E4C6_9BACT|nr:protein of unknown function [Desulfatibacillum alkenivorans DSM 16219]